MTSSDRHQVFISYNGEDAVEAEAIAVALRDRGFDVWFAPWKLPGGERLVGAIENGLAESDSCAFLIGRAGLQRWAASEYDIACRHAVRRGMRMVPVILSAAGWGIDPEERLPEYLATRTWVDMRAGLDRRDLVDALTAALTGVLPSMPPQPAHSCPYVGLESFGRSDASFFVGRSADIQRITEKLDAHAVVAVIAPMGSGKSSVVHAGVVPTWEARQVEHSFEVVTVECRPGLKPWIGLGSALARAGLGDTLDLASYLESDLDSLGSLLLSERGEFRRSRLMLVVDQFEEIFTSPDAQTIAGPFLETLNRAKGLLPDDLRILVTLRSDFVEHLSINRGMNQAISSGQYLLPALDDEMLIEAIEVPARRAGLLIQPGLAETIVSDLASTSAKLPLLQQAMLSTWDEREGNMLTLAGYRRAGSAAGAVANAAEKVWGELDDDQREIARFALPRLVHPDVSRIVRRRRHVSELTPSAAPSHEVVRVIARFADARLITTLALEDRQGVADSGRELIELTHEAVVDAWSRLNDWVQTDIEWRRAHDELARAAKQWDGVEDPVTAADYLYRGRQLEDVLALANESMAAMTDLERRFLAAAIAREAAQLETERDRVADDARQEERAVQQRKRLALVSVLTLGFAIVAVIALWQFFEASSARDEAASQRDVAEEQRTIADSLRLSAQATELAPTRPDTAALLAREASQTAEIPTSRAALAEVLSRAWTPHTTLSLGTEIPSSLAVHPSGAIIVGNRKGILQSAQVDPADPTQQVTAHEGPIADIVVDSGGDVVTAGADGRIRQWKWPELTQLAEIGRHENALMALVILGQDPTLVGLDVDGEVHNWSLETDQVGPVIVPGQPATAIASGLDPGRILVGNGAGTIQEWDVETATMIGEIQTGHLAGIRALAVRPDGAIFSGGADGIVKMSNPLTNEREVSFFGHRRPIVEVVAKGSTVISISDEGSVIAHDVATRVALSSRRLDLPPRSQGGGAQLTLVTVVGAGSDIVVGTADGRLVVIDEDGRPPLVLRTDHAPGLVEDYAVHRPDGILVRTASGELLVGNETVAAAGTSRAVLLPAGAVVFARGGDVVVVHDETATLTSGATVTALSAAGEDTVAVGRSDGTVQVIDVTSAEPSIATVAHDGGVLAVASAGPDWGVLSGGEDGAVVFTDPEGESRSLGSHDLGVYTLAILSDGRMVASGSDDREAIVWSLESEDPGMRLTGHRDKVTAISFIDGERIATGTETGEVLVWDLATGDRLYELPVFVSGSVRSMATTASGSELAVVAADTIDWWSVTESDWLAIACDVAGRSLLQTEIEGYLRGQPIAEPCPDG